MALIQEQLRKLDDPFAEAPGEDTGLLLPEGKYRMKLDSVDPKESKKGAMMINGEWLVAGGPLDGRKAFKTWVLESINDKGETDSEKTKTCLNMFKADLKKLGVNVADPKFIMSAFIMKHLAKLLDVEVIMSVKHSKNKLNGDDQQNLRIESLAGAGDEETTGAAIDGADVEDGAAFDPFAEE